MFASVDGGVKLEREQRRTRGPSAEELIWLDAPTLVAATFGRGMFKASLAPTGRCGAISMAT